MRMPAAKPSDFDLPSGPSVDALSSRSLYRKISYVVETDDHWELVVTRYQPAPQDFFQPLLGEPILLMHGFSQNRHAWTSGEFVKNLLYFGADIHILELRGHGKSSIELQRQRAKKSGQPVPEDLDYGWDIDSYFLYDLPAAVAAVKGITERDRIFFCGHSMGGMLGYGYAGLHDDFEGLITIGSAADLGRGFALLRALAFTSPLVSAGVDLALASYNLERRVRHAGQLLLARGFSKLGRKRFDADAHPPPEPARYQYVPVDTWLKWAAGFMGLAQSNRLYERLNARFNWLTNPSRVSASDIRWLMRWGGEREPRKVLEQFAKWIRRGELRCYRTGYDFKRGFSNIKIPMAIIFGDMDPLASVDSTRSVYHQAKSEYLLWRPVKGNSHIELTMGHDIRQICYDIKNLIEYAKTHRTRKVAPILRAT
jgi:pimeloyl-ACP methyl ester carboxylesterase